MKPFKIEIKDWTNHYLIEEIEGKFVVFKVAVFTELGKFNTAAEAINYCFIKMGREVLNVSRN